MRRLLHEPLAHFLGIGLLLFLLFDLGGGNADDAGREIVVDDAVVAELARRYEAVRQQRPTREELGGLVDGWVREEVLYRKGLALGFDRGDSVIRARIRQKVEVMAEESQPSDTPTEADLQAWLQEYHARYALPPLLSFEQVMLDPARHGDELARSLERVRLKLAAHADPAALSESRLLPPQVRELRADVVARQFGEAFANDIQELPLGEWRGPFRSGFGLHFVRLTARTPGRVPPLVEVRAAVARDVEKDRRSKGSEAFYAKLRENFDIRIEADLDRAQAAR